MSKNKDKENNIEEDIVYDDAGTADLVDGKLKKVKDQLKKCKEEKQEYLDSLQRARADYINLKKRSEEEKAGLKDYIVEDFATDILGVIDSFEMAFKDKESWNKAPENWRKGIEFIYNQLISVLEARGIKEISPLGDEFNPKLHHSIETVDTDDTDQDGKVVEVMQKGYMAKDKMIRFASVKVGQFKK